MNYYPFHIGDYRSSTAHLTNEEDLAYRRLLDMYYDSEQPIPKETQWVSRRLRIAPEIIQTVLVDFFMETDGGWVHRRCAAEIESFQHRAVRARENGKAGGRPKKTQPVFCENPAETQQEPTGKLTKNQEPITNNQEKEEKTCSASASPRKNGTRLPAEWTLPGGWGDWALKEQPTWTQAHLQTVADQFRDHWHAAAGQNASKMDWHATWRNWVRREKPLPKVKSNAAGGFSAIDYHKGVSSDGRF